MKKDSTKQFILESVKRTKNYKKNQVLQRTRLDFHEQLSRAKYPYNFWWLGVPIIQLPQDLQALQEIIWDVKPDLIIETGIARGGSIIFSASMLTLLEACGKIKNGHVVGIDVDIRPHNKKALLAHPMSKKITMLEGSSIDKLIIDKVAKLARGKKRIMVCLDSNHSHNHVLAELRAYSRFVTTGSYLMVADTVDEMLPADVIVDRPWGKGNNAGTAAQKFLRENKSFKIDTVLESKLVLTGSPGGYLKRIK